MSLRCFNHGGQTGAELGSLKVVVVVVAGGSDLLAVQSVRGPRGRPPCSDKKQTPALVIN